MISFFFISLISIEEPMVIVIELMEKGDLFYVCLKNSEITPGRLSIIAVEMAKGIIKFYSFEHLHRDL
jgi:hypothetical protein